MKPVTTRSLIMRDDGPALEVIRENARSYLVCFWADEPGHGKTRMVKPHAVWQTNIKGFCAWRKVERIQAGFIAGYTP